MNDHEERRDMLAAHVLLTYGLIAKVLQRLPIPIELPTKLDKDWQGPEAVQGLARTLELLGELPVQDGIRQLLHQLILDWLTAWSLGGVDFARPAPWLLDAAEYALARVEAQADLVIETLDLDMR
ncbi:hypothetical protein ACFQ07_15810 [Actinomadura adrarensis]|uniref:Uncharacterized protein n=1 Tax=Actinomadura adrarensis TaxID=1819600 RepID=A0ABW3CIA4_9ACTN